METLTANEAKQSLGKVLDMAQREPVLIKRHNHEAAIVISPRDFERLRKMNMDTIDELCHRVSKQAKAKGLTEEKLETLLRES